MEWIDVGAEELVDGSQTQSVDGDRVLIVKHADGIWAIDNRCKHQGAPLDKGVVKVAGSVKTVTCPAHGSMFDLETGKVRRPPASKPVTVYEVKAEGGRVYVRPRQQT
jgi:nitrite reductase/ring-hydroxylating ferredoxin subunit